MTAQQAPRSSTTAPHRFNPVILREYDIRGIVGEQFDARDAYYVGRVFGSFVVREGGSRVCIGYDGRPTSPDLAAQVARGLADCGLSVELIGLGPTPMLYFSVRDRLSDAGVMITGSHNPAGYNGFKLSLQSRPVYGAMIAQLGEMAASGDFVDGEGSIREIDVRESYITRLLKDFTNERALKVAWDIGNGAAGAVIRDLVAKLPGEHILLFDDIDGTFPNHHPDPTVDKNLDDLRRTVQDEKCDVGIAFDGDADRIGVIDENGRIVRCDTLLGIYAAEVLEAFPDAPIIADVKCSQNLFDEIKRLGGVPLMWKTGHSPIKAKMAETKAPLAGELSGHIFFNDKYYGYDDGLYCAIRLLNILAGDEKPLSSYIAHLPALISTPEQRIAVEEDIKFTIAPKILAHLRETQEEGVEINDIDGIRVTSSAGWWLVRPSNTEAALVVRMEASSLEALEKMKETVSHEIDRARNS